MEAARVIARNFPWCPENDDLSFGGRLHEEAFWSWDEYWLLEQALFELCGAPLERELQWRVFRIFSYCFSLLGCHLDPNDGYEISNLCRQQFYEARERFQMVFEGFFEGSMPSWEDFEPANPLLSIAGG